MRIAILTGRIGSDAAADDQDTLAQAQAVLAALGLHGHQARLFGRDEKMLEALRQVADFAPQAVFNLAETVDGRDDLAHAVPDLLAAMGLPCTGSGGRALLLSNDKPVCKRLLLAAGVPTPAFVARKEEGGTLGGDFAPGEYILKPSRVHASQGIDLDSVILCATAGEAARGASKCSERLGLPCFAEKYVEGREFSVALLAGGPGGQKPQVLPPAEMRFEGQWMRPILTYAAKWDESSREFADSRRSFDFPPEDAPLIEALRATALACWRVLGLAGYARVDFRVDAAGLPQVIDVNANPCLAPGAGFPAACGRAGVGYEAMVARILCAAASGEDA